MLEAALEYIEHGWSIFPIGKPKKKGEHGEPLIRWGDYQNRVATEKEVREWFKKWPDANIAIVTGQISGIVVVDIDPRKSGKREGLPPTGCVASTGGGGWHYIYAYPKDGRNVRNQANNEDCPDPIRRGRDVRASGGYINAAPSLHHSGGVYSWEKYDPSSLGEAPEWALSKYVSPNEDAGGKEKWLVKLIEEGSSPGKRNDDLIRFAGYLASTGMPEDVGGSLCTLWNEKQRSPLGETELSTTVKSAYKTERKKHPNRHKKPLDTKTARALFQTLTLNEFMVEYGDQEIRWTVDGWLPESTIGFIASPPGGFKTWMTFDLATSIASGKPFLGKYPVDEPGPVILVQQEDFNAQTASRNALVLMRRLNMRPPDLALLDEGILDVPLMPSDSKFPLHFHADRMLRFDDPEIMDALEMAVEKIRPKLVIADPFYRLVPSDDYMVKAVKDLDRLKTMRDRYGTSFLLVHHTTKSSEKEWGRGGLWGSQFLNAFSETLWQIRRPEGEEFNLIKRSFKLDGVQDPIKLNFVIRPDDYHFDVMPETITKEEAERLLTSPNQDEKKAGAYGPSLSKRILEALSINQEGLSSEDLALSLEENLGKVERAVVKLAQRGDIDKDAGDTWRHAVVDLS